MRVSFHRPNLVRLIAVVTALVASAWFVVVYTRFADFLFRFEHEGGRLSRITEILVGYGSWLYVLAPLFLFLGLFLLLRRPQAVTTLEVVLSLGWLLALGASGLCILAWQVQNVPVFSRMEWHW
jgi:hypothetical protein